MSQPKLSHVRAGTQLSTKLRVQHSIIIIFNKAGEYVKTTTKLSQNTMSTIVEIHINCISNSDRRANSSGLRVRVVVRRGKVMEALKSNFY